MFAVLLCKGAIKVKNIKKNSHSFKNYNFQFCDIKNIIGEIAIKYEAKL